VFLSIYPDKLLRYYESHSKTLN